LSNLQLRNYAIGNFKDFRVTVGRARSGRNGNCGSGTQEAQIL